MLLRAFIRNLYHDYLYDYHEYKNGKLNLFRDIIFHYGQWILGFVVANLFCVLLIILAVLYIEETWRFFLSIIIVMLMFAGIWISAGMIYNGDRPTIGGINDNESMPRWLR